MSFPPAPPTDIPSFVTWSISHANHTYHDVLKQVSPVLTTAWEQATPHINTAWNTVQPHIHAAQPHVQQAINTASVLGSSAYARVLSVSQPYRAQFHRVLDETVAAAKPVWEPASETLGKHFLQPTINTFNQHFVGLSPFEVVFRLVIYYYVISWLYGVWAHVRGVGLKKSIMAPFVACLKKTPIIGTIIAKERQKTLSKLEAMVIGGVAKDEKKYLRIPEKGESRNDILVKLKKWKNIEESHWNKGQVSGGIYHGGQELLDFLVQVYGYFALSNPLHPEVFPFIRKMEAEVIRMTINMFNGDDRCCGTMTSGGTESILMAMKSYRDYGRSRGIQTPEIIAAVTVHAAFDKAAEYMGLKLVHVPVDPVSFRLNVAALKKKINKNTVVIVGSAPCFPQGVIDDIPQLSRIAVKYGLGLHVDCCLGGFLLPWVEKLGYKVPLFDFRLPGVTSISADTHKYGYAPKGTSVVMYRTPELRQHQYFVAPDWTGGIYASPSMPGSRPGGLVAAAWAAMVSMGVDGYMECARAIMESAKAIEKGINAIDGLKVLGKPDMSVIAFAIDPKSQYASKLNIFKVGEAMSGLHWNLNTLQKPGSIHICCTYLHKNKAQEFIKDLQHSVTRVIEHPELFRNGSAAIYGMTESLPDNSLVSDMAKGFIDALFKA